MVSGSAGKNGAVEEAVGVVTAIKTVSEFTEISSEVFGANAVVGSDEPGFCVGDVAMDPGESTVERERISEHHLVVEIDAFEVYEGGARVGVDERAGLDCGVHEGLG